MKNPLASIRQLAVHVIAIATLALTTSHCITPGAGTSIGMTADNIVNGMTRKQIEWVLGSPKSIEQNEDSTNAYYDIGGRRWQLVFKGNTLTNHHPVD